MSNQSDDDHRWPLWVWVAIGLSAAFFQHILGCAPAGTRDMLPVEEEIVIDTIDRWDAWTVEHPEYAPVSDGCYELLMTTGVYVVRTHGEMLSVTGHCGPRGGGFDNNQPCPAEGVSSSIAGQARYGYIDRQLLIVIANTTDWCFTFPHEIVHLLPQCMGYGSNPEHTRPYWLDLGVDGGASNTHIGPDIEGWDGCRTE